MDTRLSTGHRRGRPVGARPSSARAARRMRLTAEEVERYYRLRWTRATTLLLTVLYGIIWLLLAVSRGESSWPVVVAGGCLLLAILVWWNFVSAFVGVYEVAGGIVARGPWRDRWFDWAELSGFYDQLGTKDVVYARLRSGSRCKLSNLLQGQRVVWEGGETRDIVGVLTERLGEHAGRLEGAEGADTAKNA